MCIQRHHLALIVSCMAYHSLGDPDVRVPPSIIRQQPMRPYTLESEEYHGRGSTVKLTCDAIGHPNPRYDWELDGKDWEYRLDEVFETPNSGNRTIEELSDKTQGEYQCFARNKHGSTMSRKFSLKIATIAQFGVGDTKRVAKNEGDPVALECSKKPHTLPPPAISWDIVASKESGAGSSVVKLSERIQIDDEGRLVFANLLPADANTPWLYRCTATSAKSGLSAFGSYKELIVNPDPAKESRAPVIQSYTGSTVQAGVVLSLKRDNVTLRCLFSGLPTPRVEWRRVDGRPMPIERIEKLYQNTVLRISNVQDYDEAVYRCTGVVNGMRSAYKDIPLTVESMPIFIDGKQPMDANKTLGEDVTFQCVTDAEPHADIMWYKDTVELTDDNKPVRVTIEQGGTILRVSKVCKSCSSGGSDISVYSCSATNRHGSVIGSGYLNVLLPTKMTQKPKSFRVSSNTSLDKDITFVCAGTTDDSTPLNVKWLRDEYGFEAIPDVIYADYTSHGSTLHISTANLDLLEKEFQGNYTCHISNGYSTEQATASLSFAPGAKPILKSASSLWWVFLIVGVLLFFIIIFTCCYVWVVRNRGDVYDVDEKERMNGFDPDEELDNMGYHEYQRPPGRAIKGSRASLSSTMPLDDDGDETSIAIFSDLEYNTMQFNKQYSGDGTM